MGSRGDSELDVAAGVERPDKGTVAVGGADLWTDEVRAREPMAYVPEQPDLMPYATVSEILLLVERLRKESESAAASACRNVVRTLRMEAGRLVS